MSNSANKKYSQKLSCDVGQLCGEVNKCPLNGVVDVHYSDYLK